MLEDLTRRRFLGGIATAGSACLLGTPVDAKRHQPPLFALYPIWLSEPISGANLEGFPQPRSVIVFHTGYTGLISAPAMHTGTHDFACDFYDEAEALAARFSRAPGSSWWEAAKGEAFRGFPVAECGYAPQPFAEVVESWSTVERPIRVSGIGLIACVLNDPTARQAAVAAAEFARAAGLWTFALVSVGKVNPAEEAAKEITLRKLREAGAGLLLISSSEVLEVCGKNDEADPELSNEGLYLCELASIIATSADDSTNISTLDVAQWLGSGGWVHLKRIVVPCEFRNRPRRPLAEFSDEAAAWFNDLLTGDRCLISSSMHHTDTTSLVSLVGSLLDSAERKCGGGNNVVALNNCVSDSVALLALSHSASLTE